jgi:hypothetical protein
MLMDHFYYRHFNEVTINGQRVEYNFCGSTLDAYDKFPVKKRMEYLGTSKLTYHNGRPSFWEEEKHFWKLKV